MIISPPEPAEYPEFYHTYVSKVIGNTDLVPAMKEDLKAIIDLVSSLPTDMLNYRYQPGKWTIKEILSHVIDAERVFAYRTLLFARNDKTLLPGFDHNQYIDFINGNRSIENILKEIKAVRESSIALFEGLAEDAIMRSGITSGGEFTVRAKGYIILGHSHHHMQIFRERYLREP
ncbi:MAG: DinB family protein [Bacteroidetes bacterium]|nr:DinB family protein [Bacteroidota bacterium]MDA1121223.1 DinB family protein [Bacteroidota bacterium]